MKYDLEFVMVPLVLGSLAITAIICLYLTGANEEKTNQLAISNGYVQVERVGSEGLRWDKVEAF